MSNEEQMRKEFEAWCISNKFNTAKRNDASSPDFYFAYETEQRWLVWQACASQYDGQIDALHVLVEKANTQRDGATEQYLAECEARRKMNQQLESERVYSSMQFDQISALNQQVLELSAQVEVMKSTQLKGNNYKCNICSDCYSSVQKAFSILPSATLQAHDNEVAAKALEELLDKFAFFSSEDGLWLADAIQVIANERRNRK